MKRLILLPAVLALCACGADDAHLNVQHDPVYIDHPVACVKPADVPTKPAALPPRPADARQGEAIAVSKVREWEGYGDHADPLLRACTADPAR
jgi:hypothetical protein